MRELRDRDPDHGVIECFNLRRYLGDALNGRAATASTINDLAIWIAARLSDPPILLSIEPLAESNSRNDATRAVLVSLRGEFVSLTFRRKTTWILEANEKLDADPRRLGERHELDSRSGSR